MISKCESRFVHAKFSLKWEMFCFLVNPKQKRAEMLPFVEHIIVLRRCSKSRERRCFYWFLFIFPVSTSQTSNIFIRSWDILACLLQRAFGVEKFIMPSIILNNLDHFSCFISCSVDFMAEDGFDLRGWELPSGYHGSISDCLVWWLYGSSSKSNTEPKIFYSNVSQMTFMSFLQLVPLTGWLPVPLPSQIRCMTVPGGPITHFEVSPCKQYLIIARKAGDPQLWHIMSNRIIGSFKGME